MAFRDEVVPLVSDFCRGNVNAIRNRAKEALLADEERWRTDMLSPLEDSRAALLAHGDVDLSDLAAIVSDSELTFREIGTWLMLVLGEFLDGEPIRLRKGSAIPFILVANGWPQSDSRLLLEGNSMDQLLGPPVLNQCRETTGRGNDISRFFSLRRAKTGWLSANELNRLAKLSPSIAEAGKQADLRTIPNIDHDNPVVVEDFQLQIQADTELLDKLVAQAASSNKGLLISRTTYA